MIIEIKAVIIVIIYGIVCWLAGFITGGLR